MSQNEKSKLLLALHHGENPLVLYNIWDAGGAKVVEKAGAPAVATGSWSVAAAHGYGDGEAMPMDFVLRVVERICASVDAPVTVDFEGGYAVAPEAVAENVRQVIGAGAVGINFEDRIVCGEGLHALEAQVARLEAIRDVAAEEGVELVVNARTDLFLGSDAARHESFFAEAVERATAYAEAGAACFFVPGLGDLSLIARLVDQVPLPVNVMMIPPLTSVQEVAALGVARVSFGPGPYSAFCAELKLAFGEIS